MACKPWVAGALFCVVVLVLVAVDIQLDLSGTRVAQKLSVRPTVGRSHEPSPAARPTPGAAKDGYSDDGRRPGRLAPSSVPHRWMWTFNATGNETLPTPPFSSGDSRLRYSPGEPVLTDVCAPPPPLHETKQATTRTPLPRVYPLPEVGGRANRSSSPTGCGVQRLAAHPLPERVPLSLDPPPHVQRTWAQRCLAGRVIEATSLLGRTLALVVISSATPRSLLNSMRTWDRSGLLDMVDDRVLWLNAPSEVDIAIGSQFGFRILSPSAMQHHRFKTPFPSFFNTPELQSQRFHVVPPGSDKNTWKFGPSFAHAMDMTTADYVLFLEKDFVVDPQVTTEFLREELLNALVYLERGAMLYRLRSRKDIGASGVKDCCVKREAGCSPVWMGGTTWQRQRNWFFYMCDSLPSAAVKRGLVAECDDRRTRCFTSYDSNWSNNPFIVKREWLFNGLPKEDVCRVALWGSSQSNNGMMEVNMLNSDWGQWKVPMCMSYQGVFQHHEVDG